MAVSGEKTAIPCDCTPTSSHPEDKPVLILWYKDNGKLPIYRYLTNETMQWQTNIITLDWEILRKFLPLPIFNIFHPLFLYFLNVSNNSFYMLPFGSQEDKALSVTKWPPINSAPCPVFLFSVMQSGFGPLNLRVLFQLWPALLLWSPLERRQNPGGTGLRLLRGVFKDWGLQRNISYWKGVA